MKSQTCRYCGKQIGKTRKFLCLSCKLKAQFGRRKVLSSVEIERKKEWDKLSPFNQKEILFAKAKQILRGMK